MHSMRKWFVVALAFFLFTLILLSFTVPTKNYMVYQPGINEMNDEELIMVPYVYRNYSRGRWRSLSTRDQRQLSRLGRILFLDEKFPTLNPSRRNYSILIWNQDRYFRERSHMKRSDPFKNCPVKNCAILANNSFLKIADIVIFDIKTIKASHLPTITRKKHQLWAFLLDQNPLKTSTSLKMKHGPSFKNVFNWSMTYRMKADIPIPYGRTVALRVGEKGFIQNYVKWDRNKKQDVLMAIISSNCVGTNHRWKYVQELQRYLKIDMYGNCGSKLCESDLLLPKTKLTNDCPEISRYKFYLAFEHSNCDEYITEKVWWYGYAKGTIPVVMGGAKDFYERILPPYSYINIENFAHPRDLVNYIMYLNHTPSDIQDYFQWRKYFKVLNEHGHFYTDSVHYCRICEALNYNNKKGKTYGSLNVFWNNSQCQSSWDGTPANMN